MTTETSINFDGHAINQQEEEDREEEEREQQRELEDLIRKQFDDFDLDDDDDDGSDVRSVSSQGDEDDVSNSFEETQPDLGGERYSCSGGEGNSYEMASPDSQQGKRPVHVLPPVPSEMAPSLSDIADSSINWDLSLPGETVNPPGLRSGDRESPVLRPTRPGDEAVNYRGNNGPVALPMPPHQGYPRPLFPGNSQQTNGGLFNNYQPYPPTYPMMNMPRSGVPPNYSQQTALAPGFHPGAPLLPICSMAGYPYRHNFPVVNSVNAPPSGSIQEEMERDDRPRTSPGKSPSSVALSPPPLHLMKSLDSGRQLALARSSSTNCIGLAAQQRKIATRDVGVDCVPMNQHDIDQLEILYKARGRRIEELQSEVARYKEEKEKEARLARHRLTLLEGEKNGMVGSLEQSQNNMIEGKNRILSLQAGVEERDKAIARLTVENEQALKKLSHTEKTVESLNSQLVEMTAADCMKRARDQQNQLMASLRQKHDAQLYDVKAALDKANSEIRDKDEHISRLQQQVDQGFALDHTSRWEQSDLINKLSRSLEESQRHNQELLTSSSTQEMLTLRSQVKDLTTAKNITDEVNQALQDEVREVKEQLVLYENAVQLGAVPLPKELSGDNSMGLTTPTCHQTNLSSQSLPAVPSCGANLDQTVASLRMELERCLANYRTKRQQVTSLQDDLFAARRELQQARRRVDKVEQEAKDYKERIVLLESKLEDYHPEKPTAKELSQRDDVERLIKEKKAIQEELQEHKRRMDELIANEETLTVLNQDMCSKIASIHEELGRDKQDALDRLQAACAAHYDDVKTELVRGFGREKQEMDEEWERRIAIVRAELDKACGDLVEVKALYVDLCKEKEQIEQQLEVETQSLEVKLRDEFNSTKESALDELKRELRRVHEDELTHLRQELRGESAGEVDKIVEDRITEYKVKWLEEADEKRQVAVKDAEEGIEQRVTDLLAERLEKEHATHSTTLQDQVESALSTQRSRFSEQLETERQRWKEIQSEDQRRVTGMEEEKEDAKKQLQRLRDQVSDLTRCLATAETRHKESCQRLEEALEEQKAELEEVRAEEEAKVARERDQVMRSSEGGSPTCGHDELIQELRTSLSESESRMLSLESQVSSLQGDLSQRGALLTKKVAEIGSLEMENMKVEEERDRLRAELETVKHEMERVKMEQSERWRESKRRLEDQFRSRFRDYCSHKADEWMEAAWQEVRAQCGQLVMELARRTKADEPVMTNGERKPCKAAGSEDVRDATGSQTSSPDRKDFSGLLQRTLLACKLDLDSLTDRLSLTQRQLQSQEEDYRQRLTAVEYESEATMEAAKKKIADLCKSYTSALEALRSQHEKERQSLLNSLTHSRDSPGPTGHLSTGTQTDSLSAENDLALRRIRDRYIDTVAKIRAEVLTHVVQSQSRAAQTVGRELHRAQRDACRQLLLQLKRALLMTSSVTNGEGETTDNRIDRSDLERVLESVANSCAVSPDLSPQVQASQGSPWASTGCRDNGEQAEFPLAGGDQARQASFFDKSSLNSSAAQSLAWPPRFPWLTGQSSASSLDGDVTLGAGTHWHSTGTRPQTDSSVRMQEVFDSCLHDIQNMSQILDTPQSRPTRLESPSPSRLWEAPVLQKPASTVNKKK